MAYQSMMNVVSGGRYERCEVRQRVTINQSINQCNVQCTNLMSKPHLFLGSKVNCLFYFCCTFYMKTQSINQSNMIYHADNLCACRYVFSGQKLIKFSFRETEREREGERFSERELAKKRERERENETDWALSV